jgi:hypothetical protein
MAPSSRKRRMESEATIDLSTTVKVLRKRVVMNLLVELGP